MLAYNKLNYPHQSTMPSFGQKKKTMPSRVSVLTNAKKQCRKKKDEKKGAQIHL